MQQQEAPLDEGDGHESAMALVDAMKPEHRALVHEYGLNMVLAFLQNGVTDAPNIRHLIRTVRNGAQEPRVRLGHALKTRGEALLRSLDPWLISQGAGFSGRQVVQVIRDRGYAVLPLGPTTAMIEASLSALDGMSLMQRQPKHVRRLQMALNAGDKAMWGPR